MLKFLMCFSVYDQNLYHHRNRDYVNLHQMVWNCPSTDVTRFQMVCCCVSEVIPIWFRHG